MEEKARIVLGKNCSELLKQGGSQREKHSLKQRGKKSRANHPLRKSIQTENSKEERGRKRGQYLEKKRGGGQKKKEKKEPDFPIS